MCIIEKVFHYEETELPVIKYKDEIWVKADTVANILRYKNTMKSIRDMLTLKTKENCQNWVSNPNRTKRYVWTGMRKTQFISTSLDYTA